VCVCVSVTALAGATSPLQAKIRHQQKALNVRNKMNVGLELKILSSIVMTVKVKQGSYLLHNRMVLEVQKAVGVGAVLMLTQYPRVCYCMLGAQWNE